MRTLSLITVILFIALLFCSGYPVSAAEAKPDNIKAVQIYNLAVDEANVGNYSQAENLTSQALAIQPNFTLALVTRASVLMNMRNLTGAEEALNKAIAIDPNDSSVLATMASYNLEKGENHDAITYASKALAADPTLIEAWIIKGTAHGSLGDYDEELNASEQALALDPANKLALSNKAYASGMKNQGKKTPMSIPISIFAMLMGIILIVNQRKV